MAETISSEPAPAPSILVADDDPHIVELVTLYLRRAGFTVVPALDGDAALRAVDESKPALAVLDIMMPGQDGLQVCRALRRRGNLPIIFLTARGTDVDRIAGLRLGADDYLVKPFNPDELVARIEAVLRRAGGHDGTGTPESPVRLGDVELDPLQRTVTAGGYEVSLTPREFELLAMLMRFPNVALDREQLLDLVWGTSFYAVRTVDVHVARLRDKLRHSQLRIETVWGSGYRLRVEDGG